MDLNVSEKLRLKITQSEVDRNYLSPKKEDLVSLLSQ